MNILAIGAHFDDVELGCGGTLARHVLDKDNVYTIGYEFDCATKSYQQVNCSFDDAYAVKFIKL